MGGYALKASSGVWLRGRVMLRVWGYRGGGEGVVVLPSADHKYRRKCLLGRSPLPSLAYLSRELLPLSWLSLSCFEASVMKCGRRF